MSRNNQLERTASALPTVLLASLVLACCGDAAGDEEARTGATDEAEEAFGFSASAPSGFVQAARGAQDLKPVASEQSTGELLELGFLTRSEQSNAETFQWSTPGNNAFRADVRMEARDSHLCVLTRVSGNLGGDSVVAVHRSVQDIDFRCRNSLIGMVVSDSDRTWKLGGCQYSRNSLAAEGTCVPYADFLVDPEGVVRTSSMATVTADRPSLTNCKKVVTSDITNPEAVSFLQGVMGYFAGGGEKLEIIPGSYTALTKLRATTSNCSDVGNAQGGAMSFIAGILGVTVRRTQTFSLSAKSNQHKKTTLIPTSRALCYLTKISGSFDGGGERLRIYPEIDASGVEQWVFEAKAQGGSAYGSAECVYYDQRLGDVIP